MIEIKCEHLRVQWPTSDVHRQQVDSLLRREWRKTRVFLGSENARG